MCDVIVNEIGSPILGFSVYNPDKKVITEFTKNELNFLANTMFLVNGIRRILTVVVNVTQVDLAMIGMLISELTSVATVRFLLNKKEFINPSSKDSETNIELLEILGDTDKVSS